MATALEIDPKLFDDLTEVMDGSYASQWLKTANPAFDHSTPLQVIERGESDRIWHMIYRLQTREPV